MQEIQRGLYLEIKPYFVKGKTYYTSVLTAGDGYCFYDKYEQIFDENSRIVSITNKYQRPYMRKDLSETTDISKLNDRYVSVPIEEGFEIV